MGTGKTTIGKLVAEKLGWRFIDSDRLIEQRVGKSIAELFAEGSEAHFRQMEADLCVEIAGWRQTVVATGGGMVIPPANFERLKAAGLLICLNAPFEHIMARLADDTERPLHSQLAELWAVRAPHYAAVPHQIDTAKMTPYTISESVIELWRLTR